MDAEIDDLERALDALLRTMTAEDDKPADGPVEIVVVTAASLMAAGRMSRLDLDISDLKRRPLRAACRQAVRRIGEHLFKVTGSTDAMSDILERVCDMDPPRYGHRASIVDHAWDGLGTDSDRWCC